MKRLEIDLFQEKKELKLLKDTIIIGDENQQIKLPIKIADLLIKSHRAEEDSLLFDKGI